MIHSLIISVLTISSAVASSKSDEWQADYGKALAATRADDRPLLVVLDVPKDPNKAVEDDQLKTDGDQAELLSKYQLCHIDASTEYGKRVAKVFKAKQFPFTAIIDKTGSIVLHKKQGQLTDDEWNETLSTYKTGDRSTATHYTTSYRGSGSFTNSAATSSIISPSYCPSCQRKSQQSF